MDSIMQVSTERTRAERRTGKHAAPAVDMEKAARVFIGTAAAGIKVGLYIGTAYLTGTGIVQAAEIVKTRRAIPGGEIFTIPMIVALFVTGWTLRGDVERAIRRYWKNQRWRQRGAK